ncbi:thylakoid ADP,ATP carrier protein, chloroplastic-like [Wolffia australiana]
MDATLFMAAAAAGAARKTLTAPLDCIKLLMQTHSAWNFGQSTAKGINFFEAFSLISREEGVKGYGKGNLPQVASFGNYPLFFTLQIFPWCQNFLVLLRDCENVSVSSRIVECGGVFGVNSGFVPNALKSLPNSSIKLTAFNTVKGLIAMSQKELQRIIEENRAKMLS